MSHAVPEDEGESELNLVPYLDIITNLVIFLIFSFQIVVQMRQVTMIPPAMGLETGGEAAVTLTAIIHAGGYRLVGSHDLLGAVEIPLVDGQHDDRRLHDELVRLKGRYGLGEDLLVTAAPNTEYALVVRVMDAARHDAERPLFPDVRLARGG